MTTSPSLWDLPKAGIRKNRACDECRSRKLACSKDPDGCARCKREGIQCHYSAQKPMGRPRKRRHTDDAAAAELQLDDTLTKDWPAVNSQNGLDVGSYGIVDDTILGFDTLAPMPVPDLNSLPLDPDLAFPGHSHGVGDTPFLDLLPGNTSWTGPGGSDQAAGALPKYAFEPGFSANFHAANILGDINFNQPEDESISGVHNNLTEALRTYINDASAQKEAEFTSRSATSSSDWNSPPGAAISSTESSPPPTDATRPRPVPSINCSCLSSLYMALDSLARLPDDVRAAVRVARNACKVAHDVAMCPGCSLPLIQNPTAPPSIQAWQNLMLLGALLPSACNAYARILEMVDEEASLAKKEGKTIHFAFKDVGGIWGYVVDDGTQLTSTVAYFNDTDMAPDLWRTAVRAMLRLDVYGFGRDANDQLATEARNQYRQLGLRDVVELLDRRHEERHNKMDEAAARGEMPKHSDFILFPGMHKPVPKDQRNCVKILDAARIALDNLVIT